MFWPFNPCKTNYSFSIGNLTTYNRSENINITFCIFTNICIIGLHKVSSKILTKLPKMSLIT